MIQQYDIAFSIYFKHDFFADGKLRCLTAQPTTETAHFLRDHGGLVKILPDGLHVLYDSLFLGEKRSRAEFLESGITLKFSIQNTDTEFFNYTTDFNTDISSTYFLFKNNYGSATAKKEKLHRDDFVGKDDITTTSSGEDFFFEKPFGLINIQLHKELEQTLSISFTSNSTYWCYIINTGYLQELTQPAIIDKETKQVFNGPEEIQLNEKEIGLAFFSTAPIAHMQRPNAIFQLVEEYEAEARTYKVILPALPRPSINHISSIKNITEQKKEKFSFIFI